ncbi:hypothetical protein DPMN_041352 [Dreissena polymorpha]|uniref:Uncharacterized protein n=1 Tax=Dreissena polymorpha TaxID=45954 RepID=A0A9D4CZ66_DREPO|nr:hypothetical protein DPMN_041352 [Dreissena polymorpha]
MAITGTTKEPERPNVAHLRYKVTDLFCKVPVPNYFFGYVWDNRMSTNHRFRMPFVWEQRSKRLKHSRESQNTKPPTNGKENISVAANLFLEIKVFLEAPSRDVLIS